MKTSSLLYILTSNWVLHTPNTGQNIKVSDMYTLVAEILETTFSFCKFRAVP